MKNPFTPAFGIVPLVLAGREDFLDDMASAFENGLGDPNLSTLLVGARGTGKTALLARLREMAQQRGWIAAGVTALDGMLQDIEEQTAAAASHILTPEANLKLSSIGLGPISASWELSSATPGNWRTRMTKLLDELAPTDTGLLITVDEVQAGFNEMITLAAVYQHFATEGRQVGLVIAGLPYQAHRLVADKSVSFLRRASLHELDAIEHDDVASALQQTFQYGGKTIEAEALDLCTEAAAGFPYMLQLVGYRTWAASGDRPNVSADDARHGIKRAASEFEQRVLAATYRKLSGVDKRFLAAMLKDRHESTLADVSQRMGVKSNYASKYKARLLAQGVINDLGSNTFTFAIPRLRPYLEARLGQEAWEL